VKRGWFGDRITILAPEYDDCRRLAQAAGVPIQVVYDEARQAATRGTDVKASESPDHPGG
jgi:uncharacterized protein (DUF111 family)